MDGGMISMPTEHLRKLVSAPTADGALLYLYLLGGGDLAQASQALAFPPVRLDIALASLRQLGLYDEPRQVAVRQGPPQYQERDVLVKMEQNTEFPRLVGEIQRRLNRILTTGELKIILTFVDYLGLPPEVIGILITYCIQRDKAREIDRRPSLRSIEQEAYRWADMGINTLEEAASYIQTQMEKNTKIQRIFKTFQMGGRRPTAGEEKYMAGWLEMGFGEPEIAMAFEKTCLNTGGMKWAYCNSILKSWREQGLLTSGDILARDKRPEKKEKVPMGSATSRPLNDLEWQALEQLQREYEGG